MLLAVEVAMRLLLSISCADPLPGPRSQPALKLVLEKKKQALEIVNRVGVRALQIRSISCPPMWRALARASSSRGKKNLYLKKLYFESRAPFATWSVIVLALL